MTRLLIFCDAFCFRQNSPKWLIIELLFYFSHSIRKAAWWNSHRTFLPYVFSLWAVKRTRGVQDGLLGVVEQL